MGDRANFGFTEGTDKPTLFLYAHSLGYGMMNALAHALDTARPRWDDDGYATRIVISQIIGEVWDSEYGFGLYIDQTGDNEHSVPVVNWETKTVSLYPYFIGKFDSSVTPKFVMGLDAFVKKFSKAPSLV
jgi:hypothetical protein